MLYKAKKIDDIIAFMCNISENNKQNNIEFLIVAHVVPTIFPLLEVLSKKGKILGVIPKRSSFNENNINKLKRLHYNVLNINKTNFSEDNFLKKKLLPLIDIKKDLIVIDVGGYFSKVLKDLNKMGCVVGIVEDTENGLKKYEAALKKCQNNKIPILSVARNKIKSFEDYLIGRNIAEATLKVLADNSISYNNLKFGILGFGEVGKGAAFYLQHTKGLDISIYDYDSRVYSFAIEKGFKIDNKETILKESDVLICLTGNKSIVFDDLHKIKKGCYISSCTSREDEFDLEPASIREAFITTSHISNIFGLNFINNGDAVNFLFLKKQNHMVFPYIYLTLSSLIKCADMLSKKDIQYSGSIIFLPEDKEEEIISSFVKKVLSREKSNSNVKFIDMMHNAGLWR
jgi:S-adenosylhomocysteine hydrolase